MLYIQYILWIYILWISI